MRRGGAMFALLLASVVPFSHLPAQALAQDDSALVAALNPGPVWDIDVHSYETHARVQHFVGLFSGKVRAVFEKSLQRQTRYGALIRQKLREGGLPEDMTYLALIESWYDPNAFSKAAAVGIWQFMAGTGRGVGLRVDWWMDERRDPMRSTEAAVRLLSGLRAQFGSLYLAAAAYDGGDGRVSRGLVRLAGHLDGVEGEDRFFSLAETKFLRQETRDYVPKIIAAALVGKEPSRYGVTVESLPPLVFDTVRVAGATPLAAVANATGATAESVHELNLHLLRGMTPPGDSVWVRVSAGTAEGFDERFAALEPGERIAVQRATTKKGESMSSIARAHGLTATQLGWYNPKAVRLKSGNLAAGQEILVPTRQTVSVAADVPNPSLERYQRRAKAPAKGKTVVAARKLAEPVRKKTTH
jgi:membrane-bound lytic murein transglycosylase D